MSTVDPTSAGEQLGRFGRLARWVLAHRVAVAVTALIVTVVSGFIGLPPDIDGNLLNLLPETEASVRAIKRINAEEGGMNTLNLTFASDDEQALDTYVEALAERFEAMDDVAFALYELDEDLAKQIGLMQLSPDELATLNGRLDGALQLGSAARNPMVAQRLMDMGPLTEKIQKLTQGRIASAAASGGEEGRARLIVRPVETSSNPKFARQFMKQVDALMAEMPPEAAGVELLWMGGAYRHNVEDLDGIQHDLVWTSMGAATIVLLLMVVTFRSVRALAIVFPPLIAANLVNLAFVKVAIGALNTYTSFGTAILFGLGIDFAIHLVGRYREYVAAGMEREEAIVQAWDHTGPPCVTAAATSAAGFLALGVARFVGFQQLGVVLAVGLMLCLVSMLVLLPVLLATLDHETRPLLGTDDAEVQSQSRYHLSVPGSITFVLLTVVIGWLAIPSFPMAYDLSELRRDGLSYAELDDTQRQLAKQSYSPIIVFLDEGGMPALAQAQARVNDAVADGSVPHVAGAVSLASVIPEDQDARLEQIRTLVAHAEDENLRYLPRVLAERLVPLRGLEVKPLSRDDIPDSIKMLVGAGNETQTRLLLLPKGNMWDVREAHKLADEVRALFPDQPAAGEYLGISSMFLLAFEDLPRVTFVALLLVAILAALDLRRPVMIFGALATLLGGLVWGMGAVRVAGIQLSMVNIAGLPILLGIGVDVVIHLLHRLEEEGPGGIRRALRTTGVAAAVSTLTTVGSFAALSLAGNRGVRGMGLLVTIGLLVVTAVAMSALPLVWSAGWKLAGKAPADQPREG